MTTAKKKSESTTPAHQVVYPSPETKNDRRINWKPITDRLSAGRTLFMSDEDLNRSGVKYLQLFFDRLGDPEKSFHSSKITREDVPGRYIWVGPPTGLTDVEFVEIGEATPRQGVTPLRGIEDEGRADPETLRELGIPHVTSVPPLQVWDETAPPPTLEELKVAVNELREAGIEPPYLITGSDITGDVEVKHATADVAIHLDLNELDIPSVVAGVAEVSDPERFSEALKQEWANRPVEPLGEPRPRPRFHDNKPEPKPEPKRATISPR